MAAGPTDLVEAPERVLRRLEEEVEELHLVEHTEGAAFAAGAVVGAHDEDGVVEQLHPRQAVDESPDLVVGVLEEGGERLLEASRQATLRLGQLVPRFDARVAGREVGSGWDDAQRLLAGEPAASRLVPAVVVATPVAGEVLGRRLVRGVGRAQGEVREERSIRPDRYRVVHELECLVDQVLGEVVAVLGRAWRVDPVVVVHEVGRELVGFAVEETVEAVEAPLERPGVVRAGRGCFVHRAQVPFAHHERRVAGPAEHLGHRGGLLADPTSHVGEAGVEVGDRPHTDGVVVPAGEKRGARGRAQRRDMKVAEAQPAGSQPIDVRRGEVGPVAAEVGEPEVVEQDHDDVRRVGLRMHRIGPPRLGVRERAPDRAAEAGVVLGVAHERTVLRVLALCARPDSTG